MNGVYTPAASTTDGVRGGARAPFLSARPSAALPAEDRVALLAAEGMRLIYGALLERIVRVELSRLRSPLSVSRRRASCSWSDAPGPERPSAARAS